MKRLRSSSLLKLCLKLAITFLVFWLIFRSVDTEQLKDILKDQDRSYLLLVSLVLLAQIVGASLRWQIILNALTQPPWPRIRAYVAFKIFYICSFFSCCLPAAGSDVVRVWLAKAEHISLPVAINSVLLDRMIALGALLIIVVLTLPTLGQILHFDTRWIVPLLLVAGIAGFILLFWLERLLLPFERYRLIRLLLHFVHAITLILKNPKALAASLGLALFGQITFAFSAWMLGRSLSIDITLLQCLTLLPPVLLALMIPISIGGWGLREIGIIGMLGFAGVPRSSALILSLELGLLGILVNMPGSLFWLSYRKQRPVLTTPPADTGAEGAKL